MNAAMFVVFFVVYTLIALCAAVWHYSIDPSLGGAGVLHVFNIFLGFYQIGSSISMGLLYGWKE